MTFIARFARAALYAALALLAIAAPAAAQPAAPDRQPVTILISIDGFRTDYLDRGITPNLSALAARGASAPMKPSFPTKTFPNHYTLVTGLRPDHHGIVSNNMIDPRRPAVRFSLGDARQALDPFWWDEAEPLWVTAERSGIRTATMFWPGSEVAIRTIRPSDWNRFDENIDERQRVETVLDWMRRPAEIRPRFVAMYFDRIDTGGHHFGPDSAELNAAVAEVDSQIGYLIDGLAALGQQADIIVVSDHGMRAVDAARTIDLDALLAPESYLLVDSGPFATVEPAAATDRTVYDALLTPHDHMQCWQKDDIPARLAYGSNPRVAEILCLAEPGWTIRRGAPPEEMSGGTHGWDNEDPQMQALFIAAGPRISTTTPVRNLDNVDVYALLAALVGVAPQPNDGDGDALVLFAAPEPGADRPLE